MGQDVANDANNAASEIPGYDVASVEEWVGANDVQLTAPFTWTKLEGGHSNLTYRIDDAAGRSAVIRRPPMGKLLPKAHDMGREWSCIRALWGTGVPVAEPIGFCEDPSVTGAHFYIMGLVDGKALYNIDDVNEWVPETNRAAMADSWIDVLATLHSLDPDELGLTELGRKEDYIIRQCKTWYRSWTSSIEAAAIDDERIHSLHDFLVAEVPEQGPATVVHGDYGTHNVMIAPAADGSNIAAVVDWEIATLGDPMADFAYSMNAWVQPDDPMLDNEELPSLAPGFPSRDYLINRYADITGRDMTSLPYYRAFNKFKTACILHGVYARYRNGQKAIEADELELLEGRVHNAIESAVLARSNIEN